ncbi:SDR family NAD(P)-dependent oxidoreductase [Kitasatospora sp. NPDC004745]|uniref:SDR family NAD(P)-dependent oxidoreductase n=1 Tax=Kitasatospora sp. NPDC004745 TaxID=3364019 RepID=UPI0036C60EAD
MSLTTSSPTPRRRALVIGASRGLGLVLAEELARRGWEVVATARRNADALLALAEASDGRLTVESLEMTSPEELAALRERLGGRALDLLFVNAAIDRGDLPITEVGTEMFTEVMITNALSPLRAVEALRDLVPPGGTVAVMSSDQGSVSRNTEEGYELYKASKAALNQLMRSHATRCADDGRTKLLIDPGHNRTELGGPDALLAPEESIPAVVDVLEAQAGAPGLQFLDLHGETVPW